MAEVYIGTGQNITKDCIAGDREMNRYLITNGLTRPRRIGADYLYTICGVDKAAYPSNLNPVVGGDMIDGWYSYKAVYASSIYVRPVANLDGSGNYTRGNPSNPIAVQVAGANNAVEVTVPTYDQAGITHVLIYRSFRSDSQPGAQAGPWYYAGQVLMGAGPTVLFTDTLADTRLGLEVETDNYPPSAYRYAVAAFGYIFMGGNFVVGENFTCTVVAGSSFITANGDAFYDGIIGWRFQIDRDISGGVNQAGLYYANYISPTQLQLIDADGDPIVYNGTQAGVGRIFACYIPGNVLRWCKYGEPEAFPLTNIINFEGDITGIAQIPNQSLLAVFTDTPSIWILDMVNIGSSTFKTNKNIISTTHTTTSHWSITPVESRLRAINMSRKAIIEIDGASAKDITGGVIPKIFDYLNKNISDIKLWHCAYDPSTSIFGAFCTFKGSQRMIDFSICQHVSTGGWFFNYEKDLLCTGRWIDPDTNEELVLGGTEGPGSGKGGVWGRIWTPNYYDEWIPSGSLRSGIIVSVTDGQNFIVDNASADLWVGGGGLAGRWVLVCDSKGEYAQLAYIWANTVNTITIRGVVGSIDPNQFNPLPQAGWKFYCGLIECKWGPKRFDFGDPDINKKVWEVWCCVSGHDENNPPFLRTYRGFEEGYDSQYNLKETQYLDRTETQSLVQLGVTKGLLTDIPRWGLMWIDRSYNPTILHSLTIVYNMVQRGGKR